MSGSSRASRVLSRCVVVMDSGKRISWVRNPDGSDPGSKIHARQQESFRRMIDNRTPAIEMLFDDLECSGHEFTAPNDTRFQQHCQKIISHTIPQVEILVLSEPRLSESELGRLVEKVFNLMLQVE